MKGGIIVVEGEAIASRRGTGSPPGGDARAGVVYRKDDGRFIDDDGVGWYAGIGLDVRHSEHWSLGPFVTYERVGLSIDTETVLVSLTVTFSY